MREEDREPIATIALIAALADGNRGPEEEARLAGIASALGGGSYDNVARDVLSGKTSLTAIAGKLSNADARREAYQTAVAVCHADGTANEKERAFLADLKKILEVGEGDAGDLSATAAALAEPALPGPALDNPPPNTSAPRASQAGLPALGRDAALDALILQHAMLAGALELLPQQIATLAILPVQLRMVYRIGADFGQKLDAAQVKDLAAVMGIGAAAQVMEGMARRLIGGIGKALLGRLGGVAGGAAGAGLTFAATYALGHAARQYYEQGRQLSGDDLRSLFSRLRDQAKTVYPKVEAQIQQQAAKLDLGDLMRRLSGAR